MADPTDETIRVLADAVRRRGLAAPALMLLDLAAPLTFFGEQLLLASKPFIPSASWHERADALLRVLRDDRQREELRRRLGEGEGRDSPT